jgi:hypothetical protein
MTRNDDLNDVLNLIKIRFRYFEWKLSMFEEEEINNCIESLDEIIRELNCILNLNTLTGKDRITAIDYLNIVRVIIDG